ncbi:MAG TPA: TRAP transporter large permease [Burkholderiaceae bacterium]|nr:TRAP transporter large permease [Burkholderiaceae bacterium]
MSGLTLSLVVVGVFCGAMLLAVPVAFALMAAAVAGLLAQGGISLMVVPQQIFGGIDNLLLLAIPFFLLAGDLMTAGGLTERLLAFCNALFGRFRGGLALSNVASATFMAGLSGSAVADTSALGRVLIPAMVRNGYSPAFAAALTGCANVVGPIIPPSITFVLIGVLTNLSIGQLFLAGILPGILYSLAMALVAWVQSVRRGYPVYERVGLRAVLATGRRAFWALVMPVLIITGIRTGVFNVTECSAVAVVYALIVGKFIYRELTWREIGAALVRCARTTAMIMIVLGGAQLVSWLLAYQNVPQQLADVMLNASKHPWVFLLLVNILLLGVGTFMENGPALVMLAPVLYPIAAKFGIDPYHFSMVVAVNLLIGLITPPVALCLSIGALIGKVSNEKVLVESVPFFFAALAVLALVTYVPAVSLWLPSLFGGR